MGLTGEINFENEPYKINKEFELSALQLADTLDLDELESARLLMASQIDAETLDRDVMESAIVRFHEKRQYLLECIRLALKQSIDTEIDQSLRATFQAVVHELVHPSEGSESSFTAFSERCLRAMVEIVNWLKQLAKKAEGISVLGQSQPPALSEVMEYQRISLIRQHESLGSILAYLTKAKAPRVEELKPLLLILKDVDTYNSILIHYVPYMGALISHFGTSNGAVKLAEARMFNQMLIPNSSSSNWGLRCFQAATRVWWVSEYSGWFTGSSEDTALGGIDISKEAAERSSLFNKALDDGAFDFLMSLSVDVKYQGWEDPIRHRLRSWLQTKAPYLPEDAERFSEDFQMLVAEQIESFIDAFIGNMPDSLRQLRIQEDEQRLLTSEPRTFQHTHELEKFLVIISYVYEHRTDAAQAFWTDSESNLFGFLHWAAKRQTTPRASAFCEMLISISSGVENATAAHKFLLDDGLAASGKLRRTNSLNWNQLFAELQYFATKSGERPATSQSLMYTVGKPTSAQRDSEPETQMMLESYLRLIAHLCYESSDARDQLLEQAEFHLVDLIFVLCSGGIPSRIRACSFKVLQSLLQNKSRLLGESIWTSIDTWMSGGISGANLGALKHAQAAPTPAWTGETIFETIASGFEESNAFVGLLQSLVAPYADELELCDTLPFPENVGSATRMPGIEMYVDFAVGRVFGLKSPEIQMKSQQRILILTCLDFIYTSLSTFNEDLIILANKSNISVDSAIRTSTLAVYAQLHPFSRTMEWLFNEKVLSALFAAAHEDVTEVNAASPDSVLILGLLRSIEVMNLVLDLQSTYLDIIGPLVKLKGSNRRSLIANPAIAFFEDAVLNQLNLVVDLGLYCGTAHQNLTIGSLQLLQKLASSRRLAIPSSTKFGQRSEQNKLIGVLEMNHESDRVSRALSSQTQVNHKDLELGPETSAYVIKASIIAFLNSCLSTTSHQPTIAHLLLGFSCQGSMIEVVPDGLFANSRSLFHAVLQIALFFQDENTDSFLGWMLRLRCSAIGVLGKLWKAPLSSVYTLTELRSHDYLFNQFVQQSVVNTETLWDGYKIYDPEFLITEHAAPCLVDFLSQRIFLFEYAAAELRLIAQQQSPTLKDRILSTLLGSTVTPEGDQISNASIFDLSDFLELELGEAIVQPVHPFFADIDFTICTKEDTDGVLYSDIPSIEELLALRRSDLRSQGKLSSPLEEQNFNSEAQILLLTALAKNRRTALQNKRSQALKTWVQLIFIILSSADFSSNTWTTFILQVLQVTLPKLEKYSLENAEEAAELARLSDALIHKLDFTSSAFEKGRAGDVANDVLFQLFRVSLRCIHAPGEIIDLRKYSYSTCLRYLAGMAEATKSGAVLRRYSTQTIQTSGDRLIDVLCDDCLSGSESCRVSALLLLGVFVSIANLEESSYLTEYFNRLNFIGILVDSIKSIPLDLREAQPNGIIKSVVAV